MDARDTGPYVGLEPFQETDREYFKGRDSDVRVVIANLRTAPLTVLYGAAGVGKTSLLLAGVLPQLRQALPKTPVVIFRDWARKDFQRRLARACIDETWRAGVDQPRPGDDRPLDEVLRACAEAAHTSVLLLLDQFEEYLLYHPKSDSPTSFEAQLARVVNREDVDAGILIAVREASLSQLDRFRERIPHLLGNTIRLEHLDRDGAIAAIGDPVLDVWNRRHPDERPMTIEPALVQEVVKAAASGELVHSEHGGKGETHGAAPIEAALLQLVMSRIWQKERQQGSTALRLATYVDSGRAETIIQLHLEEVMAGLDDNQQAVCATFFDRLVTPSGTKVPCNRDDLLEWAGPRVHDVPSTLDRLSDRRILRTVTAESDTPEQTRYEIFHEVLAHPILNWRGRYVEAREREIAMAATRVRTRQLWLRWVAVALILALAGWARSGVYRFRANANRMAAESMADVPYHPTRALTLAIDGVNRAGGMLPGKQLTRILGPTEATEDALRLAVQASRLRWTLPLNSDGMSVAFSPDGTTVATRSLGANPQSNTRDVTIWNVTSGNGPVKLAAHAFPDASVYGRLAFVPQSDPKAGNVLAVVAGSSVWLWRVGDPSPPRELPHGLSIDTALAISRDGRRIATAGFRRASGAGLGSIKIWDAEGSWDDETGSKPLQTIDVGGSWVMGLAFSPDGCCIAAASVERGRSQPGYAAIWHLRTGQRILDVPMPVGSDAIAFSPDGDAVVLAGRDSSVRLLRLAPRDANEELDAIIRQSDDRQLGPVRTAIWNERILAGHLERVRDVAFSPDGSLIASASGDKTVKVWDAATGENVFTLLGHEGYVEAVAFGPRGDDLVSVSRDDTLRVWNLASHTAGVYAVAFNPLPGSHMLATASGDHTAKVWDVSRDMPRLRHTLDQHAGTVYRLAFDPRGERLVTASFDHKAHLWNVRTGELLHTFTGHTDELRDVAFNNDGTYVATASADRSARLYSVADSSVRTIVVRGNNQVSALAMDPNGPRWVTGGWDGVLQLWDYSGKPIGQIPRSQAYGEGAARIVRAAFTRHGTEIAALIRNTVYFWPTSRFETNDEQPPRSLQIPDAPFCEWMAFSPDETQVAVACADGAVRVYRNDGRTQALVKTVRVHRNDVKGVAFSADGKMLGTASLDKSFQISPVDFWDVYDLAIRRQRAMAVSR